jgi:hypothetical protein
MSVVYFPTAKLINGLYWYGCRGYRTTGDALSAMSDKDYRRKVDWEVRNAAWLASLRPHDGDKQQGGGNAA